MAHLESWFLGYFTFPIIFLQLPSKPNEHQRMKIRKKWFTIIRKNVSTGKRRKITERLEKEPPAGPHKHKVGM